MSKENGVRRTSPCDFSQSEHLCKTLDRAGVPTDAKWRTLILYMRGIDTYDFLSDGQKARIQELVIRTLQERDYSDEKFMAIMREQEEILNGPCNRRLQAALSETAQMVEEFRTLLRKRGGEVANLGDTTVEAINSGEDPEVLLNTLKKSFQEIVDIMQRDADTLDQLSRTDSLTGLMNRRALDEFLNACLESWQSTGRIFSLLMLDIDHFKKFNDNYGHRIGDQALATVSKIMGRVGASLEAEDIEAFLARYGGEEFSVVLPAVGEEQAVAIAEDLREQVSRYNFIIRDSHGEVIKRNIHITVSIGVAEISPQWRGAFIENLVDSADKALYRAKASGRDRVCSANLKEYDCKD